MTSFFGSFFFFLFKTILAFLQPTYVLCGILGLCTWDELNSLAYIVLRWPIVTGTSYPEVASVARQL